MNALLAPIRAYLAGRSTRERWFLVAATCVVALTLVYLVAIAPLSARANATLARTTELEGQVTRAIQLASEMRGLQGELTVFFEAEDGTRKEIVLGPWDCVSCPRGVVHGYQNNGKETLWLMVMLGKSTKTELLGYADPKLFENRDAHLRKAS